MIAFLSPLFLIGAAAAAVPIVLHLLKRQPEARVRFAAVRLLKTAPVERTARRRLRELLLLAARVAALALIAVAFARPFVPSGAALTGTGVTIVALDTSYSMTAPGRFARAQQLAREAVGRAPAGNLVGVIAFADTARVAARPAVDRALANAAIDAAAAGYGATHYRPALAAAGAALDGRGGTIVVVTDLQASGWDAGERAAVPESARVEVADVGSLPPNLAVTAVRTASDRIVATVRNAGPRARDARVTLSVDGGPARQAIVALEPNQSGDATFGGVARGSVAHVAVADPEGLQADNDRYAIVGEGGRGAVLVVTRSGDLGRDAFYVEQALGAADGEVGVAAVSAADLTGFSEVRLGQYSAVVVLATRGLERRARELMASYVAAGGGLIVAAGPEVDGELVADLLGPGRTLRMTAASDAQARTLAPADARHPLFQSFGPAAQSLSLVRFQTVMRVSGDGCQTIAQFTSGEPALLDCSAGEGHTLVFASDLDNQWNDFPRRATFVPFLHEAVAYVGSASGRRREYLVADAPAGTPRVPGIAALPGTRGVDQARERVVINVDPREADPERTTVEEFQSAVVRLKDTARSQGGAQARQQEDRQHLWQYVLGMTLVVLAIEGAVASRTA